MNWKYVLKRVGWAVLIYLIACFIYSGLFNAKMDKTLKGQIEEQVQKQMTSELMNSKKKFSAEERAKMYQERIQEQYETYHLDEPLMNRIFWRGWNTFTFEFGKATHMKSKKTGSTQVYDILMEVVPRTLMLFLTASSINLILMIILGMKKAQKPGQALDNSTTIIAMARAGLPTWWLGLMLLMLFVYVIPIFPSGGLHSTPVPEGTWANFFDLLYHLALPLITLVLVGFWRGAYITRNLVLGTLQEDFIMSARARGLSERRVLYGHALRTAAPPLATMIVMTILATLGGSLIFEAIFNWPGMGRVYWEALQTNDIPVMLGNTALLTILYLFGIVFLDLIYGFLDPRIKVGGKA